MAPVGISRIGSASLFCVTVMVAIVLILSLFTGEMFFERRSAWCDEIYVVKEGETLHTISIKCGDPYILEQNPHINDFDDVFPGLVLKITPAAVAAAD